MANLFFFAGLHLVKLKAVVCGGLGKCRLILIFSDE